tara:strand:+ start:753 stop:1136 length:384 start_codon:yes stop_codon:yes gene_type:complete
MISKQDLFNCITIGFTTCLVIATIIYIFYIQNKQYEGLTMQSKRLPPPSSIAESIKTQNEDLDDELQIEKYRENYEDIIMNYEEYYYLDTIKRMVNTNSNNKRRKLLSENALNVKALDDTAKFIYSH